MDGAAEGAVTGEAAGATGGEGTELSSGVETGATGADHGGEGGQGGAAGEGGEGGAEGGAASGGEGGGEGAEGGAARETKKDDVNKRFSEVTRQRDESQRREREARDQLSKALEALDRVTGGKKPEVQPGAKEAPADDLGAEPEPPIFEDPEQYQRDMAAYTQKVTERAVKMQLRADRANQEREAAEQRNREAAREQGLAWMARREKAMEEMPDYTEVAENDALHISNDMAAAITRNEHGPKIAYYLGQHPELAERISKMHPVMQLMEIGKLEAQITAPKPPKVSKTPEPIRIEKGSGEPQAKSVDEMSMEEYAAQRNKRH